VDLLHAAVLGTQKVAGELGVKNAAIHYHFPTKEALGCAVVKRYQDRFQLWINNARVKDLSPEKKTGLVL
jgi:TetR/AcrR family transcriptional repressor of nem operon